MSELIGPIHRWLYNKIITQESINMQIFHLAQNMEWSNTLEEEADHKIGQPKFGPLEEIVSGENVHGWLQNFVKLEERRFAFAVMSLLKEDEERLRLMKNKMYEFGEKVLLNQEKTAGEVMAKIDGLLLNGMPCDAVVSVLEKSDYCVQTKTNKQIHEPFWLEQGGTNDIYEILIDSYIQGIISDSDFSYSREGAIRKICVKQ